MPDIIETRLVYWDSISNRWYGKQLGNCGDTMYDTLLTDNTEHNKSFAGDNVDHKHVHPYEWHYFGGPLNLLDKKCLYTMVFGGNPGWCINEYGYFSLCSINHYIWHPPLEIGKVGNINV
jgi:hypothetical protein